jgi:hypothetical protein
LGNCWKLLLDTAWNGKYEPVVVPVVPVAPVAAVSTPFTTHSPNPPFTFTLDLSLLLCFALLCFACLLPPPSNCPSLPFALCFSPSPLSLSLFLSLTHTLSLYLLHRHSHHTLKLSLTHKPHFHLVWTSHSLAHRVAALLTVSTHFAAAGQLTNSHTSCHWSSVGGLTSQNWASSSAPSITRSYYSCQTINSK